MIRANHAVHGGSTAAQNTVAQSFSLSSALVFSTSIGKVGTSP